MVDTVGQERLYQALSTVVVGDHGRMTGVGRVDERWNPTWLAVIAEHHGSEIKPHLVRRRKHRSQLVVNLDLFLDEIDVSCIKLGPLLGQSRRYRNRPEGRDARQTKLGWLCRCLV